MKKNIAKLKSFVIKASKNKSFLHHDWFVEYHLNIVERIALELCNVYKKADKNVVLALVWVHDYGKILDMKKEHKLNHESEKLLIKLGFPKDFIKKITEFLDIFEHYMEKDLKKAPIEVQIVSSADAASHMIGPFFSIYWKEYNKKSIPELMKKNTNKLMKDWERKITLPEVKKSFKQRNEFFKEQVGNFPKKYL